MPRLSREQPGLFGVACDVDNRAIGGTNEEPSQTPCLLRKRVDDLVPTPLGFLIRLLHAGADMNRDGRIFGGRGISGDKLNTKTDAYLFLDDISTSLTRGDWIDPDAGRRNFGQYAQEWLMQRTELRPLSRDQYSSLIANHLNPAFGHMELARVSAGQVRSWHAATVARRPGAAANAYRLLRAIFNTAVTDELVTRNPCRVKGAGADRAKERVIPTVAQVEALMNAMPAQLRAAVVLAAWGTLRRGEVLGLRRDDIDLVAGTVRVERSLGERRNGDVIIGPPKSSADVRTVNMPRSALRVLEDHLEDFVGPGRHASLFVGRTGQPLRPRGIEDAWRSARDEIGLPDMRFHDLRHFAGTMAAAVGASTKEVMARGGWSSPQMALRYEHAAQHRDRFIAEALEALARPVDPPSRGSESTTGTAEDSARSRTQRARRVVGEEGEISETASELDLSAAEVRPSGFEPETCGLGVRRRGVHWVHSRPLSCGYVQSPSIVLGGSTPQPWHCGLDTGLNAPCSSGGGFLFELTSNVRESEAEASGR